MIRSMSKGDRVFDVVVFILLTLLGLFTIYPFLNVLAISFNESQDTLKGGITIFPRAFTLQNYAEVLQYPALITGFINSTARTVIGTALSVGATSMVAFTLTRKDFVCRRFFNILFMVTMYVGGGLIPNYLLMRSLGLFNNFLVYIIPGLIGAFNLFLTRSYMDGLPYELQESAMLDGANDLYIFFKIIFPLCTPVLATIALFCAVGHWNDWMSTYLYCQTNTSLTTLSYELQVIIKSADISVEDLANYSADSLKDLATTVTSQSIQMAITIVVTVPILLIYPFLQKYFISGMTVGAVKG